MAPVRSAQVVDRGFDDTWCDLIVELLSEPVYLAALLACGWRNSGYRAHGSILPVRLVGWQSEKAKRVPSGLRG